MARRAGAAAPAAPVVAPQPAAPAPAPANDSLGPAYQAHVQDRQVTGDADAARAAAMARRSAAATPGATAGTPAPAASAKPAEPPAPGTPEATAAAAAQEPGFLHRLGHNLAHPVSAMEASVPLGAAALAAGGKDVLAGATVGAIPAVLGGARDATQHTLELIKSTGDWLDANVAHLPLPQSLQGAAEMPAQLPGAGTLTGTATEGVLRTGAEYLAGFAMGGKVMDAVKAGEIAGPAVANIGKGIVADFAAMDPKGERLTNLWSKLGLPANVVTDWLAAKPGDSEIEGRFKNALEGAGLGALAGGIGQAADAWKAAREAAAAKPGAVVDAATSGAPKVSLEELKAKLGDPESQSFVRRNQPAAAPAPGITAYHGTGADFPAFDPAKVGTATDTGDLGRGFYFTLNPGQAAAYANKFGDKGRVLTVNLDVKNPLREISPDFEAAVQKRVADANAARPPEQPGGWESIEPASPEMLQADLRARAISEEAKARGYDAVAMKNPRFGYDEMVVFDAEKAKIVGSQTAATAGAPKVSLEELKAKLGDPESQSFVRRNQAAATAETAPVQGAPVQGASPRLIGPDKPPYAWSAADVDQAAADLRDRDLTIATKILGDPDKAARYLKLEDHALQGTDAVAEKARAEMAGMMTPEQADALDAAFAKDTEATPEQLEKFRRRLFEMDNAAHLDPETAADPIASSMQRVTPEQVKAATRGGEVPFEAHIDIATIARGLSDLRSRGLDQERIDDLILNAVTSKGVSRDDAREILGAFARKDGNAGPTRLGLPAPEGGKPVPAGTDIPLAGATVPPAQDVGAGVVPRRPGQTLGQQAAAKVGASVAATADVPLEAGAKGIAFAEHAPSFYVNWAKIDAPEDVQRAMSQMADSFTGDLEAARRGEVSFERQKLGAQAENAWNVLVTRRQGQPLNAEQSLAARELWASSGAKLSELAQAAADSPSDANLFAFQKQLATHHMVQTQVIAARTETARALGSWRIPVGSDEERARQIDWLLANQGGQETTKELAKRMAILARQGNLQGLDMVAEKAASLTTMDAVRSVWVNAMLSSPATHLANTGDNLIMAAQQVWERYGAEKISAALGQQDGVAHGEALAQVYGMVSGWKDALRYAAKAGVTGEGGFGIGKFEEGRPFGIGLRATGLGGDYANNGGEFGRAVDYLGQMLRKPKVALGEVLNSPGTALVAEDEFFKTIGYRAEVHAQALRQATAEARVGAIASEPEAIGRRMAELVRDPPENIRMASADQAMYATLNNAPGELGKQLLGLREALNVKGVPIGHVLVPFAKVSANSMSYMLARTPLAPLMNTFTADIAAGGPRQSLAMSRMAFGSLTMMAAADLAMGGYITGSGPKDTVGRAALPRDWQPYSVYAFGRYWSYNRLGSLGSMLGIAGDLVDYFHNTDWNRHGTEPVMPVWAASILMVANNALSKTWMQSVSALNDALADPQRYGPKFFEGLAGSVVPGIVAGTAREMDPHAKDVRGMLDAIMARTPGLSDKVPNRLDLWGRPITYQSGLGGAYDMLSPVRATSGKTDEPIDKEIARQGIAPTLPQRVVSFAAGAPPTDLEQFPGAYQRYQALAGNDAKLPQWGGLGAKDYLNAVVSGKHPMSQVYVMGTDGPDGGKATFIKDVISKARAAALVTLRTERPDVRVAVSRQMSTPKIQGVPAMPAVPMLNQ